MNNQTAPNRLPQVSIALLLLIALAFATKHQLSSVPVVSDQVPPTEFSGKRAHEELTQLLPNEQPHYVDSTANRDVEKRLVARLESFGYRPEIQDANICKDWSRGVSRCTRVRNIIVHIKGEMAGQGILLSAHYDSVPAGPGGSDAGAAVATLVEIARLLADEKQPRNSIVLLFNEGEEFGLFGARAFMKEHPLAKQLKLALNIEARGSAGKSVMFETGEDSGWLVSEYAKGTTAPLSSSLFYEVYKYLPNDTDLTVFKEHGLQGLNFAHAELETHYHTPLDNLDNLQPGTIQLHGDNVWHVLKQVKDRDLSQVELGNRVYTDVLGLTIIQWPESWTIAISIGLLIVLFWTSFRFYQKQLLTNGNALSTMGMMVLAIFIAGLIAFLFQKGVQWIDSEYAPWRAEPLPMRLAIWLGVFSGVLLFCNWSSKKSPPMSALFAAIYLWSFLSLVTSIAMPGISFLFILPALVTCFVLFALSFYNNQLIEKYGVWVAVIFALMNAITFMPIAHILEVMVSFYMSAAIGIMLGFAAVGIFPLLLADGEVVKNSSMFFRAGLIVAVIGAIWTIVQPPYSITMPQPFNLVYVKNDLGDKFLVVGRENQSVSASLSEKLAESQELQIGKPFVSSSRDYRMVDVGAFDVSNIETNTISSGVDSGNRVVKFEVRTQKFNLLDVKVFVPESLKLISLQNADRKLMYQEETSIRNGYYEYTCRGESCHGFQLTAEWPENENSRAEILITASHKGLPSELKSWIEARNGLAIERQDGDYSLVVHKMKF